MAATESAGQNNQSTGQEQEARKSAADNDAPSSVMKSVNLQPSMSNAQGTTILSQESMDEMPREPDALKPAPAIRKGAVYHEIEYARPKLKKSSRSSGSRMSGYKRRETSDEYKLSRYKIEALMEQQAKTKRPEIPLVYLLAAVVLLPILIVVLHVLHKILGSIDYTGQIIQKIIKCRETSRKAIQIMSDELSCSLLIKEVSMHDVDEQHQVLFGVACLALLAPYSVASTSSQSMLMYYRQHRDGMTNSFRNGFMRRKCSEQDACVLRDRQSYINGYVDLNTTFDSSGLTSAWLANDIDENTVWNFLLRVENEEVRIFPMPKKLLRALSEVPRSYKVKSDMFSIDLGFRNVETLMNSSKIILTERLIGRLFMDFFGKQRQKNTRVPRMFREISLPTNISDDYLSILIPYRDDYMTSSIFTAFVIYTTYAVLNRMGLRNEETLYAVMIRSQRLAFEFFESSREWNGNKTASSLLSKSMLETAIEILHDKLDSKIQGRVRRDNPDRVATILYWKAKAREMLIILNLGLPPPFLASNTSTSSFYVTNGERVKESVPVSSAAGVVILYRKGNSIAKPIMAASASGSLRTVEGVASAILRMLLLDEDPGSALCATPPIYYDYRDGQYHCDGSSTLLNRLDKNFGIKCLAVSKGDREANERIVMAARRRLLDGDLVAATHGDHDFNYAVGY